MRVLARIGCSLAALALAAPAVALAGVPAEVASGAAPWNPNATVSHKHKKTLFGGEKLCAECQRAKAQAESHVHVPPPPPLPAAGVVKHDGSCDVCGQPKMVVQGGAYIQQTPGLAQGYAGGVAPGYAVSGAPNYGGAGPAAIGMYPPQLAAAAPVQGRDAAVMPVAAASDPISAAGHNRPHIISHMLNLDNFGRARAQEKERHRGEKHASIPFGPQGQTAVADLPAKMVYGK